MLLLVDVSVEVTLLARLCGIPTIVMRQHGDRNDLPHLQAYESAELLIAPFSAEMAPKGPPKWVHQKTLYAGGFSKFNNKKDASHQTEKKDHIAILLGQGGSSINTSFIKYLAGSCKAYTFHVIGKLADDHSNLPNNIIWHGKLAEPLSILNFCAIVIGNAGHNTVMELADLNKRFICIPEDRPFNEQQQKAELLADKGYARVLQPADIGQICWPDELNLLLNTVPGWSDVINPQALSEISAAITQKVKDLF